MATSDNRAQHPTHMLPGKGGGRSGLHRSGTDIDLSPDALDVTTRA